MQRSSKDSVSSVRIDTIDAGLRAYMVRVYMNMALGILLTGAVAAFVASSPALYEPILFSPLRWVFLLAPLGIVLYFGFSLNKISLQTAHVLFWSYSGLMGVSLSSIFLVYTGESIAHIFFVSAATFGAMSLYGYTTKKDLTAWGSFFFMGLIGVILASVVNIFVGSSALEMALSVMTVLIFVGLTAYDTQEIRNFYDERVSEEVRGKMAIYGSLKLYIDFINIFLALLRLFGDRR